MHLYKTNSTYIVASLLVSGMLSSNRNWNYNVGVSTRMSYAMTCKVHFTDHRTLGSATFRNVSAARRTGRRHRSPLKRLQPYTWFLIQNSTTFAYLKLVVLEKQQHAQDNAQNFSHLTVCSV